MLSFENISGEMEWSFEKPEPFEPMPSFKT